MNHDTYVKLVEYIKQNGKIGGERIPNIYKITEITPQLEGVPDYENVKLEINAHNLWPIGRTPFEAIKAINELRRESIKGLIDILLSDEVVPRHSLR